LQSVKTTLVGGDERRYDTRKDLWSEAILGFRFELVKHLRNQKGLQVLRKRWIVEPNICVAELLLP
jgi:hypothetical protein